LTPKDYIGNVEGLSIYPVGDVAHKSFQRISVAIGDGASAALDYFYGREGLYRSRQSIRELKISTQVV
jgi:alkyl hydroperoxide reductase subunit AhpF